MQLLSLLTTGECYSIYVICQTASTKHIFFWVQLHHIQAETLSLLTDTHNQSETKRIMFDCPGRKGETFTRISKKTISFNALVKPSRILTTTPKTSNIKLLFFYLNMSKGWLEFEIHLHQLATFQGICTEFQRYP